MPDKPLIKLADKILGKHESKAENLLQILIDIQNELKHIPDPICEYLTERLAVPLAKIRGVIGFYSFLHNKPRARYEFLFSDNIIEQMTGSRKLAQKLARMLDIKIGDEICHENACIDYTSCAGMSDQGPAALVNGLALTALNDERITEIAGLVRENLPLGKWPTELFSVKTNIQKTDILLGENYQAGAALKTAVSVGSDNILDLINQSGLRGRGGAGFSTFLKWRMCKEAKGNTKVIVCNADEGEPGTFKDRVLLQKYFARVIEGMSVCAKVISARQGFLYLRSEYRYLLDTLNSELAARRKANLLGKSILGQTGFDFDIKIHLGAGAYICGEETALLESLEGKRGTPRSRPPFPVTSGYLKRPTVVNNVETFVAAANIVENGVDKYKRRGTQNSPGTKLISVSGDCSKPGIYELPFSATVNEILKIAGTDKVQAVQVSGPAGTILNPDEFDRIIGYEDLAVGGSFMIFDCSRDLIDIIGNFTEFFRHESCGFCTPCRVGTSLLSKRLKKIASASGAEADIKAIQSIAETMQKMSHCGLGTTAANSLIQSINKFPEIYKNKLRPGGYEPAFNLEQALSEARKISGRNDPASQFEGGTR